MYPAVNIATLSAVNYARQSILATIYSLFTTLAASDVHPSHHLFLNLHKKVTWYDILMAVFYIILRNNAVILDPLFGKEIYSIGFLQKGISDVLFIL
ncbi:hypothetical protein SDC9_148813 [bioreactor metagenome]|uniref:Uncharacterized protein n=1 Tax=bioreactor metagenome TaxID=1076179 RepID=A0A645EM51_9ZZZZ